MGLMKSVLTPCVALTLCVLTIPKTTEVVQVIDFKIGMLVNLARDAADSTILTWSGALILLAVLVTLPIMRLIPKSIRAVGMVIPLLSGTVAGK